MLMAVTGIEDAEFAREFLQDNGWQLEPAVNQYMLLTEDGGGAGGGVPMAASPREAPAPSIPSRPNPAPSFDALLLPEDEAKAHDPAARRRSESP